MTLGCCDKSGVERHEEQTVWYTALFGMARHCNAQLRPAPLRASLPGDHRVLEPPDSIPNSEVKRYIADGSVGLPHVRVGHRQALNFGRLLIKVSDTTAEW